MSNTRPNRHRTGGPSHRSKSFGTFSRPVAVVRASRIFGSSSSERNFTLPSAKTTNAPPRCGDDRIDEVELDLSPRKCRDGHPEQYANRGTARLHTLWIC